MVGEGNKVKLLKIECRSGEMGAKVELGENLDMNMCSTRWLLFQKFAAELSWQEGDMKEIWWFLGFLGSKGCYAS